MMTNEQSVNLTKDQVELVLRGLRFVRSSISMALLDPSDDVAVQRSRQLREVEGLFRRFGDAAEKAPAGV